MISRKTSPSAADGLTSMYDNLDYQRARREIMALEARLAEAERAKERETARLRGRPIRRSVTERAGDLLAGGRVDPTSAAAAIEAHEQEVLILRGAICEKTSELDRLVADLSYDATLLVKEAYDAAMRRALAAMTAMAVAFRDAATTADELRKLGYRPSSTALPNLTPHSALLLGDPDAVGMSAAWRFKRDLQDRGII